MINSQSTSDLFPWVVFSTQESFRCIINYNIKILDIIIPSIHFYHISYFTIFKLIRDETDRRNETYERFLIKPAYIRRHYYIITRRRNYEIRIQTLSPLPFHLYSSLLLLWRRLFMQCSLATPLACRRTRDAYREDYVWAYRPRLYMPAYTYKDGNTQGNGAWAMAGSAP